MMMIKYYHWIIIISIYEWKHTRGTLLRLFSKWLLHFLEGNVVKNTTISFSIIRHFSLSFSIIDAWNPLDI